LPESSNGILDTSGVIILSTINMTDEAGMGYADTTLWLALADSFAADIYTGTITFMVANS
jgi:hypothetical protein